MILLPLLLALLIGTFVVGCVVQLVLRLSRRYTLSWRHSFAYGALVSVAGVAGLLLRFFSGVVVPGVLGAAIAFAFHGLAGGWYLGRHARDSEGRSVQFRRGAVLGLLVFVMVLLAGFLYGALQGLMLVRQGTGAAI